MIYSIKKINFSKNLVIELTIYLICSLFNSENIGNERLTILKREVHYKGLHILYFNYLTEF